MRNNLFSKHSAKFESVEKSTRPGVLVTLRGPVTGWKSNRNGRTYSRDLWVKALNSDYVKEQVALNHFVGEADHPEDRLEPVIQNMSHAMRDFEFDDANQEVIATIDILDTPCGHMLKTLYDYSGALSFSTRGSGDVLDDGEVDPDTYQLFAIDAVLRPSYATATVREALTESENLGKITDGQVKKLIEKYSGSKLTEMSPAGNEINHLLDFIDGEKWAPTDFDGLKYLAKCYTDGIDTEIEQAASEQEIRGILKPHYYEIMDRIAPDDYEDEDNSLLSERESSKLKLLKEVRMRKNLKESVSWDYFDKFQSLIDEYMPSEGEGDSMASQIVTAINKLVYKWYNDGDVYDNVNSRMAGWANDLSSYANWLAENVDGAKEILDEIFDISSDDEYEDILKKLADEYLTEEFLGINSDIPATGSIYDCDGPYEFSDHAWDDEEEDDYDEEDDEPSMWDESDDILKDYFDFHKGIY